LPQSVARSCSAILAACAGAPGSPFPSVEVEAGVRDGIRRHSDNNLAAAAVVDASMVDEIALCPAGSAEVPRSTLVSEATDEMV